MFVSRRVFLHLVAACVVAFSAATAVAGDLPSPLTSGTFHMTMESGGFVRDIWIHLPPAIEAGKPLPLVVGLHGAGGGGEHFLSDDGWSAESDAKGFIVAAPDGLPARLQRPPDFITNPRLWNSGQLTPGSPRSNIDDVTFISELLDLLAKKIAVDRHRVFVTGHSNGGAMTYVVAERLPSRIAAVATVAGVITSEHPRVEHPMPSLYIVGMKDPLMPMAGGDAPTTWGPRETLPVATYFGRWATALGCDPTPAVTTHDAIRTLSFRNPTVKSATLTVVEIEGQGHSWPGAPVNRLPERLIGPVTHALDATKTIWKFFAAAPPR